MRVAGVSPICLACLPQMTEKVGAALPTDRCLGPLSGRHAEEQTKAYNALYGHHAPHPSRTVAGVFVVMNQAANEAQSWQRADSAIVRGERRSQASLSTQDTVHGRPDRWQGPSGTKRLCSLRNT